MPAGLIVEDEVLSKRGLVIQPLRKEVHSERKEFASETENMTRMDG